MKYVETDRCLLVMCYTKLCLDAGIELSETREWSFGIDDSTQSIVN